MISVPAFLVNIYPKHKQDAAAWDGPQTVWALNNTSLAKNTKINAKKYVLLHQAYALPKPHKTIIPQQRKTQKRPHLQI